MSGREDLEFARDGACYQRALIAPELAADLLAELDRYASTPEGVDPTVIWDANEGGKLLRYIPRTHVYLPSFSRVISSRILSMASGYLKEDAYFSAMDVHCRGTGRTPPTPPHQDSFLMCFEDGCESMVSCFIALTDMPAGWANLRIIRGSHLSPTLPHSASRMRGFSSVIADTAEGLPPELTAREHEVVLSAGDALFFHSKVIHFTRQERPLERRRAACSVRMSGPSVRFSKEKQAVYARNVQLNRSVTIEEGLTAQPPKPQHV